jgi:hypothetical protein
LSTVTSAFDATIRGDGRGGKISVPDARKYYDEAVPLYPTIYPKYTFDQWLEFLKKEQLVIYDTNGLLEITVRAKDFLKYLTHWGGYPDTRRG